MAFINGQEVLFSPIISPISENEVELQEKSVAPTAGVPEVVQPDAGYDGLSKVTVNAKIPDGYIVPTGTKTITKSGEDDVTTYAKVNVQIPFATFTVTHKLVAEQGFIDKDIEITPPDGYEAIKRVVVVLNTDGLAKAPSGTKTITRADIGSTVNVSGAANVFVDIETYDGAVGTVTSI